MFAWHAGKLLSEADGRLGDGGRKTAGEQKSPGGEPVHPHHMPRRACAAYMLKHRATMVFLTTSCLASAFIVGSKFAHKQSSNLSQPGTSCQVC